METPPLQPLRIPIGWTVAYNTFRETDDPYWLTDDLLQLKHIKANLLIDLGWSSFDGRFVVVQHVGDFRGERLSEFRSESRVAAVEEIERLAKTASLES